MFAIMVANSGYVDVDVQFSYVGLHALALCIEQCNLFVVSVNYMNM